MNRCVITTGLLAAALPCISAGPPPATAAEHIAAMAFLAGAWSGPQSGGTFHAYYTTPEGGKVISYNKLIKDGQVAFHEFEVFELDGDKVVFRPYPQGKALTPLTLTACNPAARKVTFENPAKDFPTRIVYHRIADDRLVITLSDPHGSSGKTQQFDLRRQP